MNRSIFLLLLIPFIYFPCYLSNEVLSHLAREDGPYESVGALLFLLGAIAFAVLAFKPKFYIAERSKENYPERLHFYFFTILFIFACGEEISWGQRIFNFSTPEAIREVNIQEEFNLHNMEIFHGKTSEGEDKTGIAALFTIHRMYYIAFLTYLFIIPLLFKYNSKIKSFVKKISLPVPPIILGIFFIFNLAYGNVLREIFSDLNGHSIVEIKETVMALILFLLPLSFMDFKKIRKS
jgi:hypothetical protein